MRTRIIARALEVVLSVGLLLGANQATQAQNDITYQVDMTAQIELGNFLPETGVDTIRVTGAAFDWGDGVDLTNNPSLQGNASNVYSTVVSQAGSPGTAGGAYKFRLNGGWEDTADGSDRNFIIAGGAQVLPVVYYGDRPAGPMTNANVFFQVDMTPQVIVGGFTNGVSTIAVAGNINGWGAEPMTNNPALTGNASNVYSTTLPISDTAGMWSRYKFRANDGWETAAVYGVGNNKDRQFFIVGGDQVLPLVTYNDASLCDLLTQPTAVTFMLQITNGTPDSSGVPFDRENDQIFINGPLFSTDGWPTWNTDLPQMTNNPLGSDFYQQTIIIPAGRSRATAFKFGLSGPAHGSLDNEAPQFTDHVAYVRTTDSAYTMPVAQFGTAFEATRVESPWGALAVGSLTGGHLPITWLGAPCVTLQTSPDLTPGTWTDLPATDAGSSTNWPATAGAQFFRLHKRALP